MSYLSTFRPKFEENMSHLISAPLNLSKYKVLCYREKNWGPKMPCLGTFRPKFEENTSHLKSAPSNLSKFEVSC